MFPKIPDDALLISMADVHHPLATFSNHAFELEGLRWPSVEHYFNAMKFDDPDYQQKIRAAEHPAAARKLGKTWFKKKRGDWEKTRDAFMTRAVWVKCKTWPEVAEELLSSGDRPIVETSKYDYYWGCGRDLRGHNKYGQVLMAVRDRLRQEQGQAAVEPRPS